MERHVPSSPTVLIELPAAAYTTAEQVGVLYTVASSSMVMLQVVVVVVVVAALLLCSSSRKKVLLLLLSLREIV